MMAQQVHLIVAPEYIYDILPQTLSLTVSKEGEGEVREGATMYHIESSCIRTVSMARCLECADTEIR
jgi:hypothetical protein